MKLTIRESKFFDASIWTLELHTKDRTVEIGGLRGSREECVKVGEQIVDSFAKEKIAVIHNEIY